ncbi:MULTISPECIES: hypothetical protein [unclassified Roseofilum]|uniref:hypothetical protein n=1 Tax=unclassified Roseofilum TaxID=2620099 RepID=UPI001B19AF15|nr:MULTISPECIES: hypothetical protein [unclassified Roseofilum]MBP0009433.1 hypothetical protein [Roseofilum sp. Belize Diploria]MBP0034947.1 hypothetical protein [Roseofilum sp. Belize BBD 4]
MHIFWRAIQITGISLTTVLVIVGLLQWEKWAWSASDTKTMAQHQPQEEDRASSYTTSSNISSSVESKPTANWVATNTNPQTGSLLPPHLHENWSEVALNPSKETQVRDLEYCVISMAQLSTNKSPLYVLSSPRKDGAIVGELETGRWLSIMNATDQWFEIIDPTKGWVHRSDVDSSCNEKVERVNLGSHQSSIRIKDRMVGVGVHRYIVHLPPGKTLNLKNLEGTIPRVVDPRGELLTQSWETSEEGFPEWIVQPMESADYTIEVVSHDSELEYSFSVEITPLQEYAQILSR